MNWGRFLCKIGIHNAPAYQVPHPQFPGKYVTMAHCLRCGKCVKGVMVDERDPKLPIRQ